jgi:hypothetical protein
MLESLFQRPGKMAVVGHAVRAMDDGESGGMNTTVVPEWVRRRLFFTQKDPETGDVTATSGFGLPFEDLAVLDRPGAEFLAMLNPAFRFPAERITGQDFFRGIPIKNAERAPSVLRHLANVPGGQAFLDWLDYREVREGVYRANPEKLHLMSAPYVAGFQRSVGTLERLATAPTDVAAIKSLTGIRRQVLSPREQMIQNMQSGVREHKKAMERLMSQGIVKEKQDVFYVRRDVLPTDPRVLEARRLQREIARDEKVLRTLYDAERFAGSQSSLRTGGR